MPPMKTSSTSSTSGVDAAEQQPPSSSTSRLRSPWDVVAAAVDGKQTSGVFGIGTSFTGRDGLGLGG